MAEVLHEHVTGVDFPLKQRLWCGGLLRNLGVGARIKKVGFVSVKVYAVAMFVDAAAASEAQRAQQQAQSEAAALDMLQNGRFDKALQIQLVRDVTGKQFTDAFNDNLRPLMSGEEAALLDFCSFFEDKQMQKGTEVTMLWRASAAGCMDVCLRAPEDATPYDSMQPGKTVSNARLPHCLWQLYLSTDGPAPEARKAWMAALPALAAQGP